MNNAVASAMVQAAHRVEARLEEALAGVGLSIAKFEALSILVSQDRPISLSELAAKLVLGHHASSISMIHEPSMRH